MSIGAHAVGSATRQPVLMTRAAVALLTFALWASVAAGLLVVALGLVAIVQDATVHGEDWDGLGLYIGALMAAGGLIWSFPHVIMALWLVRVRRRGQSPAPVGATCAGVAGGLLSLVLLYVADGAAQPTTLLVPICAATLVLTAGVLVVAADRNL